MNSLTRLIFLGFSCAAQFSIALAQTYQPTNNPVDQNSADGDETFVTVDPRNPQHLMAVWNDYRIPFGTLPNPNPGFGFSSNGGTNWTTNILTTTSGLPPGYDGGFDPTCGFDGLGNAFYAYVAFTRDPVTYTVFVSRTTNDGATWFPAVVVTPSITHDQQDKPYLGIGPDNKIYVTLTDGAPPQPNTHIYTIFSVYSSDTGNSFHAPDTMASYLTGGAGAQSALGNPLSSNDVELTSFAGGSVPAIAPNGDVYVVWLDIDASGNARIKIRKKANGGSGYNAAVNVTPNPISLAIKFLITYPPIRASSIPAIAINPLNNYLYVAWTENNSGDLNIYYNRSSDGGNTWCPTGGSSSCNGTLATESSVNHQYFPQLSASSTGTISLAYYQGTTTTVDTYIAELYKGSQAFYAPNKKITSLPGVPGAHSSPKHAMDYMGLASTYGGDVYPCWSDFSSTSTNPYSALYNSVLKLAYENRALDNSATWHNGGRHAAKGGGKLHEAFTSGGDIIYRRSPNTLGQSWELTRRANSVIGGNTTSSVIAASGNSVHLVWERSVGSFLFDIYYSRSTDNGTSWSTPITLPGCTNIAVSSNQWNTYPVIAELNATPKQVVVAFTTSSGLKYTRSTDNGVTWLGTPSSISTLYPTYAWYLSLAPGSNYLTLCYDYRLNGVYSRTYNGTSWSSEANVNAGTGTIFDRQSSIAVDDQDRPIAAWCSQKSGQSEYRILYRQGTAANTWSPGFVEFAKTTGISDYYPSITYLSRNGTYGIDIVYYRSTNEVRVNKSISGSWQTPVTLSTSGQWANTSLENNSSGYPVRAWTDQTAIPYELKRSSDGDPKVAATGYEHHRRVVLQSIQNRSTLELEVAQPVISRTSGELLSLPFKLVDMTQIKSVSLGDIWGYVGTDAVTLPSDVKWLSLGKTVVSEAFHDSTGTTGANTFGSIPPYSLQVLDGQTGKPISTLDADGASGTATLDVSAFAGRSVVLRPSLNISTSLGSNLTLGVGDIYYEQNTINKQGPVVPLTSPSIFELSDNYPNPFNPSTRITYVVPVQSEVRLKVFDVLGGVVATLVRGIKDAGKESVEWDASGVASGVYFYRLEATSTNNPARTFTGVKKMLLVR